MKTDLRKNKLFLINTILLGISFIIFFVFLLIKNFYWPDEGRYSILTALFFQLEDIFRTDLESFSDFIEMIYSIILPAILIVTSIIYIIIMLILVIKKNKQIKYSSLIILQSIYLVTIIYVYIYVGLWFNTDESLNPALSIIMLLPVMLFAIYNLVSTIYIYLIEKKKIKSN